MDDLPTRRASSRHLSGLGLASTAIVALACIGPVLLARPHILALPLMVLWTAGLIDARARNRGPHLWLIAVMAIWANLHGGDFFGLAFIGPFALEALITAGGQPVQSPLSEAGQPALPAGHQGRITHALSALINHIKAIRGWVLFGLVALAAALAVCLGRGVKVPTVHLGVLLLLHMALQHTRHQLLLTLVGSLILAEPFAAALGQTALRSAEPAPGKTTRLGPAAIRTQPVLNEYGQGGYLIWQGISPFIDGRTDLYGDDFMNRFSAATAPDKLALDTLLGQWRVRWALLSPGNPLVAVMVQWPGWHRIYADRYAVVRIAD